MKSQLEYWQEQADWNYKENGSIAIYRVECTDGLWGFIYVEEDSEKLDLHCKQCMEEFLWFKFNKDEEFPYVAYSLIVGPTKFVKIQSGELPLPENFTLKEKL